MKERDGAELGACGRWVALALMLACLGGAVQAAPAPSSVERAGPAASPAPAANSPQASDTLAAIRARGPQRQRSQQG